MAFVAILALVWYGAILAHRLREYPRQAEGCRRIAEMWEEAAVTTMRWADSDPRNARSHREMAESFRRKAAFMRRHEARYREYARRPWVDLPRPGRPPD